MKIKTLLFITLLGTANLWGQQPVARGSAQIAFHVTSEDGKPIQGVVVGMATFNHLEPGEGFGKDIFDKFTGTTDNKGNVTITGKSLLGEFSYGPQQTKGFYRGGGGKFKFKEVKDGKWQPWNPTIEIVIKPIVNPIPMYGRKIDALTIPALDQPIGFDLIASDWVAPYGKGSQADFVFTVSQPVPFTDVAKSFEAKLTVSFSNKGDGIYSVIVPPDKGSELRLPRYALEAGYESLLLKHTGRPAEGKPIDPGMREDQNYFFRVRTVLDKNGQVQSAFYGKIFGDIACDVINSKTGIILFTYCLNPNDNDRNMEFDPSKNLFIKLPSYDRVTMP